MDSHINTKAFEAYEHKKVKIFTVQVTGEEARIIANVLRDVQTQLPKLNK